MFGNDKKTAKFLKVNTKNKKEKKIRHADQKDKKKEIKLVQN